MIKENNQFSALTNFKKAQTHLNNVIKIAENQKITKDSNLLADFKKLISSQF